MGGRGEEMSGGMGGRGEERRGEERRGEVGWGERRGEEEGSLDEYCPGPSGYILFVSLYILSVLYIYIWRSRDVCIFRIPGP